jgi:penicillin G amidase
VNFSSLADSLYEQVSPQSRNILEAYTRGVNDCIGEMGNKLPVEFDLLGYIPEPWTPQHSIIIARLMAWEMALSWWSDLTLAEVIARLGAEKAFQAIPGADDYLSIESIQQDSILFADAEIFRQTYQNFPGLLESSGVTMGSNSWAVTGSKSIGSKPILANDPHLRQSQPARWYIVHLVSPGFNLAGASVPEAPGVVIGSNGTVAWGITNAMVDDIDFYIERINSRDSSYLRDGVSETLQIRVDSIFIRDSAAVEHKIYATKNGPIISLDPASIEEFSREDEALVVSMNWAGYAMSDEINALFLLNRAQNWEEFKNGISHFGVPSQRFIYADTSGLIALHDAGFIPLRRGRNAILPSAGWDSRNQWTGYQDFEELPSLVAPEQEYIASANTELKSETPIFRSNIWEDASRITRIEQLLREQSSFKSNDFRLMQMDYTSPYAREIRDAFIEALASDPDRGLETTWAMNVIADWDLRMSPSSLGAALFNTAYQSLLEATFKDELGEQLFARYVMLANIPTRMMTTMLRDTSATWFDDVHTQELEQKADILRKSFKRGMTVLRETIGGSMNEWRWGKIHTVEFRHPLGEIEPLDNVFNVGPYSVGGNNTTVNNSEYMFSSPYKVAVTSSLRFIADLSSPDSCSVVLTTGQSGQPLSEHYADQAGLWQNGAYHILLRNPADIRRKQWPTLTLVPK